MTTLSRIITSITAQQTKLDLELVPKKNRLNIGKCNGRIPRGFKPKEETFQVVLDALALTPCYPAFVITADVPEVYIHQFWNSIYKHHDFYIFKIDKKKRFKLTLEVFRDIFQICPRIEDQDFNTLPYEEDTVSFLRELDHTEESKAYKTYLGYTTGTVPPKVSRKFKKASPSKKDSVPEPADEEHVQKGKRVKRSAKKYSTTPTTDLTEEAQMKEVRKKSLRDFYKSHPSGSGLVAKKPPSVEKITPSVTSKGTGDKLGVPDVTKDKSTESESESWRNDEDDSNNKEGNEQENNSEEHESDSEQDTDRSESDSESDQQVDDDDEDDDNDDDKSEGDEDRGMDSDDIQDKKADVGMTDA
nr:hypothetical protein [Tanacetum cinerariifolium]